MASRPHTASAWADKGRCGVVVCSRFQGHSSSVPQQGGAHTGSTWTPDGSQVGRRSRKGVDEGDTPTTDSMVEGAEPGSTPRCAASHAHEPSAWWTIRWLASGIRSDDHRLTHNLSCLHCLLCGQFAL